MIMIEKSSFKRDSPNHQKSRMCLMTRFITKLIEIWRTIVSVPAIFCLP